jgi:hypothetical protein
MNGGQEKHTENFVGKEGRKMSLEKPRCTGDDKNNAAFKAGLKNTDGIPLGRDRYKGRTSMDTVINIRFPQNKGNLLIRW